MNTYTLVHQAHTALAALLKEGDIAIDATEGSGRDIHFMSERVADNRGCMDAGNHPEYAYRWLAARLPGA